MSIGLDSMLSMSLDDIPTPGRSSGSAGGKDRRTSGGSQGGGKAGRTNTNSDRRRSNPIGSQAVNTRVFVGNLAFNVSWQDLKDFCGTIGKVNRADIFARDNGVSKGSGLVEFASARDARRAINELSGKELNGRPVQVREDRGADGSGAKAERRRSSGGERSSGDGGSSRGGTKVYVGNLSFDTAWQGLKDHMKKAGAVAHADVMTRPNGLSKGWGIVEFSDAKSARKAIQNLDGSELDGRNITVKFDQKGEDSSGGRGSDSSSRGGVRVAVGNLSFDTSWQNLKDFMRSAGEVTHADIDQRANGKSKGSGVVVFADMGSARRAVKTLNGKNLDGRPVEVTISSGSGSAPLSSSGGGSGTRVYVGNIPWSLHWSEMKDYLREQGFTPLKVDIPTIPNTTKAKGFALVDFGNKAEAKKAVAHLNDIVMNERPLYSHIDTK